MSGDFYVQGSFICRDGPAKLSGLKFSKVKVCFVSTDFDFLKSLLAEVSEQGEVYWVKMTIHPKDGMFLGRCFLTDVQHAGALWAKYKTHPKLMVTLQDDDFVREFRSQVVSWRAGSDGQFS